VIIETDGLAKRYGRTDALVDLSMEVDAGEVFGFLGPNGAGKTTAVKLLLGLARPSGGRGTVLGAPLGDRAARRRVGYLPELFRYQPWLRAREVLALHARLSGGSDRSKTTFDRVLDEVGLLERADDVVGDFSKGMQQRLGLGVALLGSPALVVLDEPTSALDPGGRADVRSIIRRVSDAGATVFLNSHLLTEVERVCDRVAIVDHGRVLASGRLDDLLGEPAVRIHATSLSSEAAAGLARFGRVLAAEDDWFTIAGLDLAAIPDVVAAIVSAGGRVHAVDPGRATLEDRYLELIGRSGAGGDVAGTEAGAS
jgi:ABC-2 type transport system ATP-binding protein